jgi:hypothetical protein
MDEKPETEAEKEAVEKTYTETIHELGMDGIVTFGGYYNEDSNQRAKASGTVLTVNERYLDIPEDERQRISHHEVQHGINCYRFNTFDEEEGKILFAFVLHPRFEDLHHRMESFYNIHRQRGYPFNKKVQPIPLKYSDLSDYSVDYTHPDEVLALLRGYQCYLKQLTTGMEVKTEPYEFIEAFVPGDLELLEEQVRFKLATEVTTKNTHLLDSVKGNPFTLEEKDLM